MEYNKTAGDKGLTDTDPLPETLRTEYGQKFESMVDEGIDSLKQAITLSRITPMR